MTVTDSKLETYVNSLTEDTTPDKSNDMLMSYDVSAAGMKKVKMVNIGGTGDVSRSGSTTDNHLAVWNGSDAGSIKDGGAVPSAGYTFPYICIQDQKAQNTAGGSFSSGAWRTRDLNTEVADTGNNASVASNQITLAAGTYRCHIIAPAQNVNTHQAILYDTTGAATLLAGTNAAANATYYGQSPSIIMGRFTLSVQSVLEVRHRCETTFNTYGFGFACNFGTEVYTSCEFWKEA